MDLETKNTYPVSNSADKQAISLPTLLPCFRFMLTSYACTLFMTGLSYSSPVLLLKACLSSPVTFHHTATVNRVGH